MRILPAEKKMFGMSVFSLVVLGVVGGMIVHSVRSAEAAQTDNINVSLAVNSTISISSPTDVTMNPILGHGQSTMDANNAATWNVKTNNSLGYTLAWQASAAAMTDGNSDHIAAYTPASSNAPEVWSVDSTASEWGAHLASTSDVVNTSTWGSADSYAAGKWLNVDNTTTHTIATRSSATPDAGDNEKVYFGAEIGSAVSQPSGTYAVTVTMTATTL